MENADGIMILVINNTAPGFSMPEAWEAQLWPQIIHFPRVVTVFLPQAEHFCAQTLHLLPDYKVLYVWHRGFKIYIAVNKSADTKL